ncbi:predicted protein [Nematostella vectensis]|uniref:Nuclear protein MDM1 n=1 Tax=Nematostella vectensis TaxID=45351 RepID=A7SBD8_NEMVE|nr:predicted protein [Nematostella vectensis]|eukprot:XP_001631049.1 predicted protein [Nematostella vectensis]
MHRKCQYESEYHANFKPFEVQLNKEPKFSPAKPKVQETKVAETLHKSSHNTHNHEDDKENRALEYKAGLAPAMPRTKKQRYVSEYQKQFYWKKPVGREAPILSAEKVVFSSQDNLPPAKPVKISMPTKSEYQLQFVKYPLVTTLRDDECAGSQGKEKEAGANKKAELQPPAGVASSPDKQQTPLPLAPEVPYKPMKFQSEYHTNFQPPSMFDYIDGAWVGADPPHLYPLEKPSDDVHPVTLSWFKQVTELRNKAQSYKTRARGDSQFLGILKSLEEQQSITLEKANKRTPSAQHRLRDDEANRVPDMRIECLEERQEKAQPVSDHMIRKAETGNQEKRNEFSGKNNNNEHGIHLVPTDDRASIDQGSGHRKREAWAEPGPIYPRAAIPPYGVSESLPTSRSASSIGSDSMSDVTLTDDLMNERPRSTPDDKMRKPTTGLGDVAIQHAQGEGAVGIDPPRVSTREENSRPRVEDQTLRGKGIGKAKDARVTHLRRLPTLHELNEPIDDRTRKLFTGRHHVASDDRSPRNDSPPTRQPPEQQRVDSKTRKLFTGRPLETSDSTELELSVDTSASNSTTHSSLPPPRVDSRTKHIHMGRPAGGRATSTESESYSSGDELSSSLSSDALSFEAMKKRKDLATKTLQRARNRGARF